MFLSERTMSQCSQKSVRDALNVPFINYRTNPIRNATITKMTANLIM